MILPETDTWHTLLRPHFASFLRKLRINMLRAVMPAVRKTSHRGVIALTFTA